MTKLIEDLDKLGLNGRRDNPLEECERIFAKQEYVRGYAIEHAGDAVALLDAFERTTSTCESSVEYLDIGAEWLKTANSGCIQPIV